MRPAMEEERKNLAQQLSPDMLPPVPRRGLRDPAAVGRVLLGRDGRPAAGGGQGLRLGQPSAILSFCCTPLPLQ